MGSTGTSTSRRLGVPAFLALAYGLSWWPWLGRLDNPTAAVLLPVGPSIAALLLTAGPRHREARRALWRGLRRPERRRWWLLTLVPAGAAGVSLAAATVSTGGEPAREWDVVAAVLVLAVLPVTALVSGPLGEELGWRGFLLPRLLLRHGPLVASLLVGTAWLAFHLPLIVTEPARYGVPWALTLLSASVVMTWLYLRTAGNLLLAVVWHAVTNSSIAAAFAAAPQATWSALWWTNAAVWVLMAIAAALRLSPRPHPTGRDRATTSGARPVSSAPSTQAGEA